MTKKKFTIFFSYPTLAVVSGSAGKVLEGLGLYKHIKQGGLELKGNFTQESLEDFQGHLEITDYKAGNVPVLANIFSLILFGSPKRGIETLFKQDGVPFSYLASDVILERGEILSFENFYAVGPILKISAFGFLDFSAKQMKAGGSIMPTNIIDEAVDQIPIINKIIVDSKKGDRVISTNFTLEGPIQAPQISINPVSLFTPGVLSKLFSKEKKLQKEKRDKINQLVKEDRSAARNESNKSG